MQMMVCIFIIKNERGTSSKRNQRNEANGINTQVNKNTINDLDFRFT